MLVKSFRALFWLQAIPNILAHSLLLRQESDDPRCDVTGLPTEALGSLQIRREVRSAPVARASNLTIETYFHVIAASETFEDGYLSQQDIDNQLAVMQASYNSIGISFNLVGTDWVVNADWANNGRDTEEIWKPQLRQGDYRVLNVYFIKNWAVSWGTCNNPELHANDPQPGKLDLDGCVVRHSTVPGGPLSTYGEGKTTVHEVGHWFGLWHTYERHDYEDGCNPVGDMVDDTSRQKEANPGHCGKHRNTCPDPDWPEGGDPEDPDNNYMGSSYDQCLTEFTAGQIDRMFMIWEQYRANS